MPRIIDVVIQRAEVGTLIKVGFSGVPAGAKLCDGSVLQISQFPKLFAKIGTTYGGNGTTTFQLPDFRGRAVIGAGQGAALSNRTLGTSLGTETHVLSEAEMPYHQHTGATSTDGAHQHGYTGLGSPDQFKFVNDTAAPITVYTAATSGVIGGAHVHSISVNAAGSGQAHENMAPSMVCQIAIVF